MQNKFHKRVFTPASLIASAGAIAKDLPRLPKLLAGETISPSFREKLFLAVTSVNRCRYCTWMHTDIAAANGVDDAQIAALLGDLTKGDFGREKEALLYAIHFAESERQPNKEQTTKLIDYYGEETATQIVQYLNLIWFANLSGNTFDAFLSRVGGEGVSGGNAAFETAFAAMSAPVLLAIRAIYGKEAQA